ncbi:MAG: DUF4190 domain-containing protein [Myxococcota bacterium]
MRAYCPNCGTQHEGMPGGRLTCQACTTSFEVPREDGTLSPTLPPAAPPAPPPPSIVKPPPSQFPTGYSGPPPTGFSVSNPAGGQTNPLAVTSLVLGILCCLPFSIGAIVTGAIAHQQIAASGGQQKGRELATAGMILGGIGVTLGALGFLSNLLHLFR